jgi:hypothetical protein
VSAMPHLLLLAATWLCPADARLVFTEAHIFASAFGRFAPHVNLPLHVGRVKTLGLDVR